MWQDPEFLQRLRPQATMVTLLDGESTTVELELKIKPSLSAPRIHGELLKLGFEVSERTVSRLMPRRRKPPF